MAVNAVARSTAGRTVKITSVMKGSGPDPDAAADQAGLGSNVALVRQMEHTEQARGQWDDSNYNHHRFYPSLVVAWNIFI